jgi:type IV pilus biogenesis protein CpaD/CtpE
MRVSPVLPLLFAMSAALSACAGHIDSIGTMNDLPIGETVSANLAAMVADPADLVRGHGAGAHGSKASADAIERVGTEHEKAMLKPGGFTIGGGGGG